MKNLLIAQSGGPTAAINATLVGAVSAAFMSDEVDKIYGAANGIKGVLAGNLIEIGTQLQNTEVLNMLCTTPSAALGSCRLKLAGIEQDEDQYRQIVEVLRTYNIGYFIYIGGNDSMDTVLKLSEYIEMRGIDDIKVMGAPKTIDNDLCEIDHTPGFGSAAKYIATTFAELACDCRVYDVPSVTIVEVMGRNAGWLTASASLASMAGGKAPQLIYLPEVPFDVFQFIDDIKACFEKDKAIIVAVSEGLRDKEGNYISADNLTGEVDDFGHPKLCGVAKNLERVVKGCIGCKVRSIEISLMQRCAGHIVSATDISESRQLGSAAVLHALRGHSGKMSTLVRLRDYPYEVEYRLADIEKVANHEKKVPANMINPTGNNVTPDFIHYAAPLIRGELAPTYRNGVPMHISLY